MKTKLLFVALFVALTTMGPDCINDPIIVAVNLDPVTGCWTVNTGNGAFNDSTTINVDLEIKNNIDESYRDKILKLRIYDIIVRVAGPYPTGPVSGDGYFRLPTGGGIHLLHFTGQYADYGAGVSLFDPTHITPDNAGVQALVNAFSDINNLPQTITLRGTGGGPAVTQQFQLCCDIKFQAEAKAQ